MDVSTYYEIENSGLLETLVHHERSHLGPKHYKASSNDNFNWENPIATYTSYITNTPIYTKMCSTIETCQKASKIGQVKRTNKQC